MAKRTMSNRRRLAIASYKPPRDGIINGVLTLDCSEVVRHLRETRERTGQRVTITAFIGAAVGRALRDEPTLNGRIHLGKYIAYEDVNVSFLVEIDGGRNLAQVLVKNIDTLSAAEVAQTLTELAGHVRTGRDANFEKSNAIAGKLPTWALRRVLSLAGFVTTGLGRPFAGQPAFPFGSAIITSIGMLGVDEAFVPPTPFTRVPLYVAIGAIRDMIFVENGQPVVRPGITLTATMDHRFVDGFQAAVVAKSIKNCFENPHLLDSPAESSEDASAQIES